MKLEPSESAESSWDREILPVTRCLDSLDQIHVISTKSRRRVLQLLIDEPLTVTQLGRKLDMPPPTVQHHVRELTRVGLVRLAGTRERRGILEKYYRAVARRFLLPEDPLAGLDPERQLTTVNELLEDIAGHVSRVLSSYNQSEPETDAVQLAVRLLYLQPQELAALAGQIDAILQPYLQPRDLTHDREYIVVHLAVPSHPLSAHGDGPDSGQPANRKED